MPYTLEEIKDAWQAYRTLQALAVLEGGKWRFEVLAGQVIRQIEGTRAERRWVRDIYQFPEFLEKVWNGRDHLPGRRADSRG